MAYYLIKRKVKLTSIILYHNLAYLKYQLSFMLPVTSAFYTFVRWTDFDKKFFEERLFY
jgi:hypothetical protein